MCACGYVTWVHDVWLQDTENRLRSGLWYVCMCGCVTCVYITLRTVCAVAYDIYVCVGGYVMWVRDVCLQDTENRLRSGLWYICMCGWVLDVGAWRVFAWHWEPSAQWPMIYMYVWVGMWCGCVTCVYRTLRIVCAVQWKREMFWGLVLRRWGRNWASVSWWVLYWWPTTDHSVCQ